MDDDLVNGESVGRYRLVECPRVLRVQVADVHLYQRYVRPFERQQVQRKKQNVSIMSQQFQKKKITLEVYSIFVFGWQVIDLPISPLSLSLYLYLSIWVLCCQLLFSTLWLFWAQIANAILCHKKLAEEWLSLGNGLDYRCDDDKKLLSWGDILVSLGSWRLQDSKNAGR